MKNKELDFKVGERFYIKINKKTYAGEVAYDESTSASPCRKCGYHGLRDIRATILPDFYKHLKIESSYNTKLTTMNNNTNVFNLLCCPNCGAWYHGADTIGIIGEKPNITYMYTLGSKEGKLIDVSLTSNQNHALEYLFWSAKVELGAVLANILFDKNGWPSKLLEDCANYDEHLNSLHVLLSKKV